MLKPLLCYVVDIQEKSFKESGAEQKKDTSQLPMTSPSSVRVSYTCTPCNIEDALKSTLLNHTATLATLNRSIYLNRVNKFIKNVIYLFRNTRFVQKSCALILKKILILKNVLILKKMQLQNNSCVDCGKSLLKSKTKATIISDNHIRQSEKLYFYQVIVRLANPSKTKILN